MLANPAIHTNVPVIFNIFFEIENYRVQGVIPYKFDGFSVIFVFTNRKYQSWLLVNTQVTVSGVIERAIFVLHMLSSKVY